MNTDPTVSYIDDARSVCLCGDGLAGYAAAVLVAADGSQDFVLVNEELIGDGQHAYNRATPEAVHEQAGPLSQRWRHRIALAPLRCGRRTKGTGRACRTPVTRPGDACVWHRAGAPA